MCVTNCLGRPGKRRGSSFVIPTAFFVLSLFYTLQASQAAQEAEDNARKAKNSVNSLLAVINDLLDQLGKTVLNVLCAFECFPDVAVLAAGVVCWLPCRCCARNQMGLLASRNGVYVFTARPLVCLVFFFLSWGGLNAHFAMFSTAFLQAEDCF